MGTKHCKGNSGVRIKYHTLLFIRILTSLQRYHLLVAKLTAYGQKNECRRYQKGRRWSSKIDLKHAIIEHAVDNKCLSKKAEKKNVIEA
jgi:hypothetical protein